MYTKPDGGCLKFYREKDDKEMSISFDDSSGLFSKCKKCEICIFPDGGSSVPEETIYPTSSEEMAFLIDAFVKGVKFI